MRSALAICLAAGILAATASIAEGAPRRAPVLGPISSPHAFKNDLKAHLVSADRLWMFVTGKTEGPQTSELRGYVRTGRRWSRDPGLSVMVDPDQNVAGGAIKPEDDSSHRHPCIGFTDSARQPALTCRVGGGWSDLADSSRLGDYGTLKDVRTAGRGLLTLFSETDRSGQVLRVVRISPTGRISRMGKAMRTSQAIAFLGLAGAPTILVQEQRSGNRYVLGLHGGRWHRITDKLHGEDGPLVSGGATARGREVIPVSDADRSPWTFSAFTFGPGGWAETKLSGGPGDAQGNLSQTGRAVWAIWQESDYRRGSFDTRIRISRYMGRRRDFSPAASVYKGLSPGPGDLQVARWHGRNFVLYLGPRKEGGRTLRAFVRPVR